MVNIIRPNLVFRGSLTPINKSRVDKIVQHYMAHSMWDIMGVHNFHKNTNGWAGIGYNFWIGFDGKIYQGRGFSVGAHVLNHNSHTIGIGYRGDFTKQHITDAQLKAGIELNKWLMSQLPNVNSTSQIVGHRDLANTTCPGGNFRMAELRNGIGGGTYTPPKTQTKPATVTAKQSGNNRIRTIQTTLNSRYKTGLKVDGLDGSLTKKALIKGLQTELNKQLKAGLNINGLWGPKTANACVTVRKGARGNLTWLIQARLYCLGYDPKGLDGIFGDGLTAAVKAFQK